MAGFYEGYTKRKTENEQAGMSDLQQMGSLVQLKTSVQALQDQKQMKSLLAESGGSLEAVIQGALKAGRPDIAAKLAPLWEMQQKAKAPKIVPPGSQVLGPDNKVLHSAPFKPETPRQSDVSRLMTERDALAKANPNDPNLKVYDAAIKYKSEGRESVQVNQFGSPVAGVDAQGNSVFFQPGRAGQPPKIVQGVKPAPKESEGGLTPENAGKVSMAQQSVESIGTVRNIIFDKEGNLQRGVVMAMNLPGVSGLPMNSQARIARSAMRNAVEAKLRLETGAAATQSEVDRTIARFMPTFADTKESAKFKLDELEKFFKGSLSLTKGIKKTAPTANDPLGLRGN